jgi:hypothetical protein
MPTIVDTFSKATTARPQVEDKAKHWKENGATSSDITEDDDNWILTTVLPGPDDP